MNLKKIIDNIKLSLTDGSMDSLLDEILDGKKENIIINDKENNIIYEIISSNAQNDKDKNISSINLGECENILKQK